jgi:hypothetical protein
MGARGIDKNAHHQMEVPRWAWAVCSIKREKIKLIKNQRQPVKSQIPGELKYERNRCLPNTM